jgi:hypothetical protein
MENRVDALKQRKQRRIVADIALVKFDFGRLLQIAPVSSDERVDDDDALAVSTAAKGVDQRGSDESGASGNQYILHA